jgi:transposase
MYFSRMDFAPRLGISQTSRGGAGARIRMVAMESTGVYWIPLFQILEERGFKVYLVNAHSLKTVPGARVMCPTVSGFSICTR